MTDQPAPNRRPQTNPQAAMTLSEIAAELGVTKERARQIECRALLKLRKALNRRGFMAEDIF